MKFIWTNFLAGVSFFLLFPGYFFYHWLAKLEVVPLFLGGYSNESSIIVFLMAIAIFFIKQLSVDSGLVYISKIELVAVIFYGYFVLIALIQYFAKKFPAVSVNHLASFIQLVGVYCVYRVINMGGIIFNKVMLACVFFISVFVYTAGLSGILEEMLAPIEITKSATYQDLAKSFLLTVCVVMPFIVRPIYRLMIYIDAGFVLFLLGARSEVAGLFVFAAFLEYVLSNKKIDYIIWVFLLLMLIFLMIPVLSEMYPESRIFSLLDFADDGSVQERSFQIGYAMDTISNNLFFGDYGDYYNLGGVGNYAHNILSVWVDLGLIGFVGLLYVFVYAFNVIINFPPGLNIFHERLVKYRALSVAFFVMTVFFLAVAKPYTDVSIAVMVALIAKLQMSILSSE